jgi:hypothetical protein
MDIQGKKKKAEIQRLFAPQNIHGIPSETLLSKKEFDDCTLTEITYYGDDKLADYQEFATRHNGDEVIVLVSTFETGTSGGDGSLNPNDTYTNWKWILVRTKGGKWRHVDHGY